MCTKTTHKLSFKTNFLTWKCRESQNQEIKKETVNFWKGRAVYLHIENQKKSLQPNQPQDISFIYQLITKKNPPTTELDYYETIGKPKVTELAKYWLINDFRQKLPLHKKKKKKTQITSVTNWLISDNRSNWNHEKEKVSEPLHFTYIIPHINLWVSLFRKKILNCTQATKQVISFQPIQALQNTTHQSAENSLRMVKWRARQFLLFNKP